MRNNVLYSNPRTHLAGIVWPPIDEKELSIDTGPPSAHSKLGDEALYFDRGYD